jgi:PAS domain S-box-containing protein
LIASILCAEPPKPCWTSPSFFEVAEYHFYSALSRAAACDSATLDQRKEHLEALAAHQSQIQVWARNCPENFSNRTALVGAEIARLQGRDSDAMRLYEQAIQTAREHGFIQNEALAYELAARFYLARGATTAGRSQLEAAHVCYARWDADGKVRQLERVHPYLREKPIPASSTATFRTSVAQMDVETVVKASQALSSEIVLGKLIDKLMRIAVEHAGAERALLILLQGDEPNIEAEATTGRDSVDVVVRKGVIKPSDLPQSALHYVIRTRERVVVDDASVGSLYSEDDYVRQKRARSVLCLPIVKQTKLVGVLYLENNLTPRTFTPERLAVLDLLASQAAISIENARLYADLQLSEAFLAEAQSISSTGSFGWKVSAGDIYWSEETFRILQYDRTMKPSVELALKRAHPEDAALMQQTIERAAQEGRNFDFEHRLLMPDGSVKHLHVVAQAKRDESGELGFVGAVMDISAQKQAQEVIRAAKARFEGILEIAEDAIISVDSNQSILLFNQGAERVFGYVEHEVIGRPLDILLPPRFVPPHREHIKEFAKSADVSRSMAQRREIFGRRKDGSEFPAEASISKLASGDEVVFTVILRDITERKRAEEALRHAQAKLAHSTRINTMGELTASIAHEVNQPLTAVVNNANACLNLLPKDAPRFEEVRDALTEIVEDADRASAVIVRIRQLARKAPVEKTLLDLRAVITDVLALARYESAARHVAIRADLAEDFPPVLGDRVQLQQVLLNLVTNGMDAMNPIEASKRVLLICGRREPGVGKAAALVSVRDAGIGLKPEEMDRLFDAFYTTKPHGMGMGLAISRSIIEAHDGRLWAEPNQGPGATFLISLPAAPEHFGEGKPVAGTKES